MREKKKDFRAFRVLTILPILLILLICLSLALLTTGCAEKLPALTFDGQTQTYGNRQSTTRYRALPATYISQVQGEAYATLVVGNVEETLYRIPTLDPTLWLTTAYGDVYCAETLSYPAPEKLTLTGMTLAKVSKPRDSLVTLDETQNDLICRIRDAYFTGETLEYPTYLSSTAGYILNFSSAEMPGILYSLRYLEYGEEVLATKTDPDGTTVEIHVGRYFVYDRSTGRFVAVDDTLHNLLTASEEAS